MSINELLRLTLWLSLLVGIVLGLRASNRGEALWLRTSRLLWRTILTMTTAGFGVFGALGTYIGMEAAIQHEGGAFILMYLIGGGIGLLIALATGLLLRSSCSFNRSTDDAE